MVNKNRRQVVRCYVFSTTMPQLQAATSNLPAPLPTLKDTIEAKNLMKSMYAQGTKMFVASPCSSSELQALTPFVNQNPIVVINSL